MTENAMTDDRFWALIAGTTVHEADPARQLDALRQALRGLTPSEIEAFEHAFQRAQRRAYTWDLWGAAYVLHGGASDDGFEYFQRWLISRGRKVFDAAAAEPDSLAEMLAPDAEEPCEFEEFAYVASEVWGEQTGIDPWADPEGRFPYTGAPPAPSPSGAPFAEDEEHLAKRYPRLWKRFGASPLG
jgi:hypothetical protein